MRIVPAYLPFLVILLAGPGGLARADTAEDVARIHLEAIGGLSRIERLQGLRAAGQTRMAGQTLDLLMWAARPNRVRIESEVGGDVLIQAWDGEHEPWAQVGTNGIARPLAPAGAKQFKLESDFDDPLYRPEERGFVVEYAGESRIGERAVIRLLVTRNLTEQFMLLLAADTYFIIRRDEAREIGGAQVMTQTAFDDFRPVLGVILPHRITVRSEEGILYDTVLDWMEPNPPVEPGFFSLPGSEKEAESTAAADS